MEFQRVANPTYGKNDIYAFKKPVCSLGRIRSFDEVQKQLLIYFSKLQEAPLRTQNYTY